MQAKNFVKSPFGQGPQKANLLSRRHCRPSADFTRLFGGVIGIIGGAVVAEAVCEMILAQVGELRRTSVAGIVDRVNTANQVVPMIGSAALAAIA